jgi:hypothetical protein
MSITKITLLSQILQLIPRDLFYSEVGKHKSDKYSKGFDTWTHMVSMIFCHLGRAESLRDISNGLKSITGNAKHLGLKQTPSKSTLSYQNNFRSWTVFRDIYYALFKYHSTFHKGIRRKSTLPSTRKIFLLDASVITLCTELFDWARYTSTKGAVKIHTLLDYDGCMPAVLNITDGKTSDITGGRKMPIPPGSIVVMDRAYIDFVWWNQLDSMKTTFVTRLKESVLYEVKEQFETTSHWKQTRILEDADIELSTPKGQSQYPGRLRIVRVYDEATQREYTFITNNFSWTARTISELYKARWEVEVFFKKIKQNLSIRSFVGTSENAVQIQIWTAMISMLLIMIMKNQAKYNWNLSNLITFLRLNLFVKIDLLYWLNEPFIVNNKGSTKQPSLF